MTQNGIEIDGKDKKVPQARVISDCAKMANFFSRLAGMHDFFRDMLDSNRGEMLRIEQIRTNDDII